MTKFEALRYKEMSPFRLMVQWLKRLAMGSLLFTAVLVITARTPGQLVGAFVIFVLLMLLSLLVSLYIACRYHETREEEWQANAAYSVHYPLTMEFEVKKHYVDKQVRQAQIRSYRREN
jgi:hypothetical protein